MAIKYLQVFAIITILFCGCDDDLPTTTETQSSEMLISQLSSSGTINLNQIGVLEATSDGRILVIGTNCRTKAQPEGYPGKIYLLDTQSKSILKMVTGHTSPIQAIAVSTDNKLVASCDSAGSIYITSLTEDRTRVLFSNQDQTPVYDLKFGPTNDLLFAAFDHSVVSLSITDGTIIQEYKSDLPAYSFDFNRDFSRLIIGCGYGENKQLVKIWDVCTGRLIKECFDSDIEEQLNAVHVLPDSTQCLVRGAMALYLIDIENANSQILYTTGTQYTSGTDITDSKIKAGKYVAVCGYGEFCVIDIEKNTACAKKANEDHIGAACSFTAANSDVFIGQDDKLYLWRPAADALELWATLPASSE